MALPDPSFPGLSLPGLSFLDLPFVAAVLAGMAVTLAVHGGLALLSDLRRRPGHRLNRRLRMLEDSPDPRQVLRKLTRGSADGEDRRLAAALLHLAPMRWLDRLAGRAGLTTPIERLAGTMAGAAATALVVLLAAGMAPLNALALAAGAGTAVPVMVISRMASARTARFGRQLPEALGLMARSLRAGHPVTAAIAMVAREMPDPLGSEFGIVYDEMTYGLDLREALGNLCRRMDGRELRYMAVAISIQHASGGNLADLLTSLARVLRDVERMHRKVRALSAEGRLSALVLSVLPFLVAFGIGVVSPGYYDAVLADRPFLIVLGAAGAGIIVGIAVMIRMVNFRI